jgi:elongation factor G
VLASAFSGADSEVSWIAPLFLPSNERGKLAVPAGSANGGTMKAYATQNIRNVGIVGHGDTGKTQLVSSLLFTAGMTPRLGRVAEGSSTTDWDEEEIARKISIQTGLAYAEWAGFSSGVSPGLGASAAAEKTKVNFLDTPGYSTFVNETKCSLIAADAALILVDASHGVQVVTEKVWDYATEYDLPRAFVINWMDRDQANFARAALGRTGFCARRGGRADAHRRGERLSRRD